MIYFQDDLFRVATEYVKDLHELRDVKQDLERIEDAVYNIGSVGGEIHADGLDKELRLKYPTIDMMLTVANGMPKVIENGKRSDLKGSPEVVERLRQDRCGILCDVLLGKEIVKSMEECIEKVTL